MVRALLLEILKHFEKIRNYLTDHKNIAGFEVQFYKGTLLYEINSFMF